MHGGPGKGEVDIFPLHQKNVLMGGNGSGFRRGKGSKGRGYEYVDDMENGEGEYFYDEDI